MPTNAELAKRVEELEEKLKIETLVDSVFAKILLKLHDSGFDAVQMKKEVDDLVASAKFTEKLVEELRQDNAALTSENKSLKSENRMMSKKIAEMEQYSRLNNVEIRGVPCTQGEDCVAILQTVGEKIGCPVSPSDLDVVHRVPTAKECNKNLLARFCSRDKKSEFISKARKAKLCLSDINIIQTPDSPVYVNEHLTPANKALFSKALVQKKEKNWMFLWTANCQIKARKTTDSKVYRIRDEADLAKIN